MGSADNYPSCQIRTRSVCSEVCGGPPKRESPSATRFFGPKWFFLLTVAGDVNQRGGERVAGGGRGGYYVLKVWGNLLFSNLGHVMFTHTCRCFSECEAASEWHAAAVGSTATQPEVMEQRLRGFFRSFRFQLRGFYSRRRGCAFLAR